MPDDLRARVPQRVVPEAGHRQASLADRLGLARDLDEHRVEDVADVAVDVVAEGAQADADLRGGDAGATGQLDGVDEVAHERAHAVVDVVDRARSTDAEHGVAEDADGTDRHRLPTRRGRASAGPRRPTAASSRAARRVAGCRSRNAMALPAAMCGSYGHAHDGRARACGSAPRARPSRTSGVPGRALLSTTIGVAHLLGVAVGLEPGERLGREARLVDAEARDDHELVGEVEGRAHHRVHDAGAGVGQHDRVVVRGERSRRRGSRGR